MSASRAQREEKKDDDYAGPLDISIHLPNAEKRYHRVKVTGAARCGAGEYHLLHSNILLTERLSGCVDFGFANHLCT